MAQNLKKLDVQNGRLILKQKFNFKTSNLKRLILKRLNLKQKLIRVWK